ncbi:tripartite tricarboxylate transporter TctB family protein [Mesorhizobium australicum]|uniref:Tripartite tricarboxylate transporter TctB family protein n=1 Tax=Mesorhizobium australicum TaxID=536018 RepID=A0A1X7MX81_9HYPH|nr:tripartite tricarboxylate transporter TctB family protein [Mesorhizobium australicum]SMH29507.1 Tripartite tricarboxylate transporter TctB family protein [Mesorhizobium australicum]
MAGAITLIIAATAAMIYAVLHYSIWTFGMPGSGLMPSIAAAIVIVACLWAAVAETAQENLSFGLRPLAYCVGLVAILPLSLLVGLLPGLAIVAAVILRFVEGMSIPRSALIAAGTAFGSWLLFERTLMVPLPHGLLGSI